ncbi:hypothetical protein DNTS_005961, partial [Danionella cerebrum]
MTGNFSVKLLKFLTIMDSTVASVELSSPASVSDMKRLQKTSSLLPYLHAENKGVDGEGIPIYACANGFSLRFYEADTPFMFRQEVGVLSFLPSYSYLFHPEQRNMSRYNIYSLLDWIYGGVDPVFEGNGGPECAAFISPRQRALETLVIVILSILEVCVALRNINVPKDLVKDGGRRVKEDSWGRNLLLVALCMTFGVE